MTAVVAEADGFCTPFPLSETLSNLLLYEIYSFYPFTKCCIVSGRIAYSALIVFVLFGVLFELQERRNIFPTGLWGGGGGAD